MTRQHSFRRDERGVNTAVGYVLAISITTGLIAMLLMTSTGFVATQQETVVHAEMDITSQSITDHITDVDRMSQLDTSAGMTAERSVGLPNEFAGAQYHIDIVFVEAGDSEYLYELRLRTTNPPKLYTAEFTTSTPIEGADEDNDVSLAGQDIVITYESGAEPGDEGTLVIQNG